MLRSGRQSATLRVTARRLCATAAALALCLAATGAAAQSGKGDYLGVWTVGAALGYAVPNTDEYGNAATWRLLAGYSPTPQFEIDVEVGRFGSSVEQPDAAGLPAHTIASGELDVRPLCVTVQYRRPVPEALSTLTVLGGVGYYLLDYSLGEEPRAALEADEAVARSDQRVDDAWGFHLGAGLEYALSERVSLAAEGRYLFLSAEASGTGPAGAEIDDTLDLNTWIFSGGVKVAF